MYTFTLHLNKPSEELINGIADIAEKYNAVDFDFGKDTHTFKFRHWDEENDFCKKCAEFLYSNTKKRYWW